MCLVFSEYRPALPEGGAFFIWVGYVFRKEMNFGVGKYWINTNECRNCPYAYYRDGKVIFCGVCYKDILINRQKKGQIEKTKRE